MLRQAFAQRAVEAGKEQKWAEVVADRDNGRFAFHLSYDEASLEIE